VLEDNIRRLEMQLDRSHAKPADRNAWSGNLLVNSMTELTGD
jgi:hypothetical protein